MRKKTLSSKNACKVLIVLISFFSALNPAIPKQKESVIRGKYVFTAAGCASCHTDVKNRGPLLAGGRAIKTPFGTFYGPNITPDRTYGIGKWTDQDFIRALREGVSPNGAHYFPVFPYTSYTKMKTDDIRDLKAYIFSLPAIAKPSVDHEIKFPYKFQLSIAFWKLLFFEQGPYMINRERNVEWNRGAYIVQAIAHCGECHTPRNFLGATDNTKELGGNLEGPDGESVPNITPDRISGIGKWSHSEIVEVLKIGILPNGDFVGGTMSETTKNLNKLTSSDFNAIAKYLTTLAAVENVVTVNSNRN